MAAVSAPVTEPSGGAPASPLVVAGIGASAGGLEAFTELLQNLPSNPGAAFVLVQHLDPTHASILPALLARATRMPVQEARDGTRLEAGQVHVISPGMDVAIADGHLRLVARPVKPAPHMPLDLFLNSLAEVQGSRAIAVILSGTGSDGTLGCKAVKMAGGISLVQDPASARYDGMPKSVIAAGCADFILPPREIAREIVRLAHAPYLREPPPVIEEEVPPARDDRGPLQRILAILKKATGADFACYKKSTVLRRVQRRMTVHKSEGMADYLRRLQADGAEVMALHHDLLINVTSFFRDGEAFDVLKTRVFPRLLRGRSTRAPLRVWVPGCATGEEAYSLAMCLLESMSDGPGHSSVQVFATDLSEAAIEKARSGVYAEHIAGDVSPERLQRFFVKVDGRYLVSKAVRDLIVFARQDLAHDPPFSRLDLVSCRNVLIYLEPVLQKRILATFHYALMPSGFLVLGKSETTGASSELFAPFDKDHRIYTRLDSIPPHLLHLPARAPDPDKTTRGKRRAAVEGAGSRSAIEREAERLLLGRYAPASVLVDGSGQVLHFSGETEAYLGHGTGAASLDLMSMAERGLVPALRRLLRNAKDTRSPQRKAGVVLHGRGGVRRLTLEVIPITVAASEEGGFLVLFDEAKRAEGVAAVHPSRGAKATAHKVAQLEQELVALREYQHAVAEEQAASQEELQSANEEALSSNEELQSINEELETAKEELQSSNEELTTLNEELQNRNRELHLLNDDLDNFVVSTTLPLLMLGRDLVLRRFTPAAAKLMNLMPADVGRPLSHLRMGLKTEEMESLVQQVTETRVPEKREVQDTGERWWELHVRPYRTRDDAIDGAVIVLVDIDPLKRSREVVEDARDFADAIVTTVSEPLLVLDLSLEVRRANQAFHELFQTSSETLAGRSIFDLGEKVWDVPRLRAMLEEMVRPGGEPFEDQVVELELPSVGRRALNLRAGRLSQRQGKEALILLAIEDVTEAARVEADRAEVLRRTQESRDAAQAASRLKDEFVATASHELRGPLNSMVGWVHVLSTGGIDDATRARALAAIDRSVKAQARLVTELLDVTRLMTGKLQLAMRLVELLEVLEGAMQSVRPTAQAKGIDLGLATGAAAETVLGDPDRLQQVIWNLLSNAVKFTPKGGRVDVWVGRSETSAVIRVRDTGIGIAPDFLPHVFERFRQADSSPSRAQAGLGLGLSIVRQLVEMHGGIVTADSPGAGGGSTFEVSLPIPALRVDPPGVEVSDLAPTPWTPAEPARLAGVRVLVVDDDPDAREILATVLEKGGAAVSTAPSAAAALAALEKEVPDVLVSDIGMPERDGLSLLREVRSRSAERGGQVPAVALTAYASTDDRQKADDAGFQAYLAKPADPEELIAKVAAVVRRPFPPTASGR